MKNRNIAAVAVLFGALCNPVLQPSFAADDRGLADTDDDQAMEPRNLPLVAGQSLTQNQVREAVEHGKAKSLPIVLVYVAKKYPGQLIDMKLRIGKSGYYYEVKYIDKSDQLLTVFLDAMTLEKI